MFFRAQNLGPLRDAEVDLSKDLIVLAGPNNSGKTYLAWGVYGLYRSRPTPRMNLNRWVRQLVESPEHAIDLAELFAQSGAELLESMATEYKTKLHLCFAAESVHFAGTSVSLREGDLHGNKSAFATSVRPLSFPSRQMEVFSLMKEAAGSTRLVWTMFDQAPPRAITTSLLTSLTPSERESLDKELDLQVRNRLAYRLFARCTLFPAERIAVNLFAKELALMRTELVDEMVDADLDGQPGASQELVQRKAGRYPWPIRDSLKTANDLANLSREKGSFAPLADEIEAEVLGGDVVVSDTGEMLFSPRGAADARLQMHLTASVVKSLSSLVFYFRYLARQGDFLIIDEPELNLHPDNQRKITRLLAKAVHLGFKVMMSTHSDYVIRELNHLVMLSKLPEGEAQKLGYDPASALAPERLGVYLFNEQHAEPVPVGETGFSIKTIDDVVNQLNADEQRLYARLSE